LMKAKEVNEDILHDIKSIKETIDSVDSAEATEGEIKTAFKEAVRSALNDLGAGAFNAFCEDLASRKGIKLILKGERTLGKNDRKNTMRSIRYSAIKVLKTNTVQEENLVVENIYQKLRDTFGF
ncbi:HsdR family type I site-specific deoxyribonuclease, partial [mine drainage metagenome]